MAEDFEIENFRPRCRKATEDELIYWIAELPHHHAQSVAARQELARRDREQRAKDHHETQEKLQRLAKPHWTVIPIFWFSLVAAGAAAVSVGIMLLGGN